MKKIKVGVLVLGVMAITLFNGSKIIVESANRTIEKNGVIMISGVNDLFDPEPLDVIVNKTKI